MLYDLKDIQNHQSKITGVILALLCMVSVYAMLHHPSVSSGSILEQINEADHEAQVNNLVHGVLIAFIMVINICLTYYGKARGLNRSSVLYGLIIYWIGTVVIVLAALLDGFVGPQLAGLYTQVAPDQVEVYRGIALLKSEMALAFAYFSISCWCAGICCWAFDMFYQAKFMKSFSFISLLAVFAIMGSLLLGWVSLATGGMTIILVAISCCHFGISCSLCFQTVKG